MASRTKIYFSIPEYTDSSHRSCQQASKLLRQLLKGYYLEPKGSELWPRMPKWWWLQKNFALLKSVCGLRGTLIIVREKKGTRRGKSLYYQTLREKGIYPRERNATGNVPPTVGRAGGFRAVRARQQRFAEGFNVDPFARRQPAVPRQPVVMNAPMQAPPTARDIGAGWLGNFGDIG